MGRLEARGIEEGRVKELYTRINDAMERTEYKWYSQYPDIFVPVNIYSKWPFSADVTNATVEIVAHTDKYTREYRAEGLLRTKTFRGKTTIDDLIDNVVTYIEARIVEHNEFIERTTKARAEIEGLLGFNQHGDVELTGPPGTGSKVFRGLVTKDSYETYTASLNEIKLTASQVRKLGELLREG